MSDLKIIILQGPPACGKSTKAKALLNQYGVDKAVIVCRDSIREACGEYWVPSREDYITDLEYFTVKNALAHNLIPSLMQLTSTRRQSISGRHWRRHTMPILSGLKLLYLTVRH